jgi:hypothetical protein
MAGATIGVDQSTGAAVMAETGNEHPTTQSDPADAPAAPPASAPRERPTPEGDALDPTRYGDWEKNGRCIDF